VYSVISVSETRYSHREAGLLLLFYLFSISCQDAGSIDKLGIEQHRIHQLSFSGAVVSNERDISFGIDRNLVHNLTTSKSIYLRVPIITTGREGIPEEGVLTTFPSTIIIEDLPPSRHIRESKPLSLKNSIISFMDRP